MTIYVEGEEMVANKLEQIFTQVPDVIYGYTDISYSSLSEEYKSALVFAVPHEERLDLGSYTEEKFENCILTARKSVEFILRNIEVILNDEHIKYYIPPMAQQNEEELLAVFSFKYAAVNAGLGWIGKNDVLVTEKYGPRVRLAVVLMDYTFEYGEKITESKCGSCNRCIDICPHKVLKGKEWSLDALRDDLIDYHLCNQKRSTYIEKHGRKNACGLCMVVCPYGKE